MLLIPLGINLRPSVSSTVAEKKTLISNHVLNTEYFSKGFDPVSPYNLYTVILLMTELYWVPDRTGREPSSGTQGASETSDTSGFESDNSGGSRKVLSKTTFTLQKSYGNWQVFLSLGRWSRPMNRALNTAVSGGKMFRSRLTATINSCANSRELVIFPVTRGSVLRRLCGKF